MINIFVSYFVFVSCVCLMFIMKFVICLLLVVLVCNSMAFPTMKEKEEDIFTLIGKAIMRRIEPENGKTIPKLAEQLGATTYVNYLQKTRLTEILSKEGPFTAFVCTNEGFEHAYDYKKGFLKNDTTMEAMMRYSVLTKRLMISDIKNEMMVSTMMGEYKLRFNVYHEGTVMTAAGMRITMPDKKASNGFVQVVNGLMGPPYGSVFKSLTLCPVFKTLAVVHLLYLPQLTKLSSEFPETLDHLMKNSTALKNVLMLHIVKGTYYSAGLSEDHPLTTETGQTLSIQTENDKYMVNTVPMGYLDGTVSNGVVHQIDAVLMPSSAHVEIVFEE